ncbi:MAG: superoxide dismutase [Methanobacteriota archaeon]
MAFELPKLPYAYDALEPAIDAKTMEIHHTKHHQAYVDNLNKAVDGKADWSRKEVWQVCMDVASAPKEVQGAIRNNGGGHWNHTHFWNIMTGKGKGGKPSADLARAIDGDLGGFDKMKEAVNEAGVKRFGSGWAWVIIGADGHLHVVSTPNQDNPLMKGIVEPASTGTPILGVDVWEHAYYLKYQNRRADYLKAWWDVVNWYTVSDIFSKAKR